MRVLSEERIALTPQLMESRTKRELISRPRSPGVHVQSVNRALGIAAGKLTDSDGEDYPFEKFSASSYPLMPALGVAWEEFRVSCYRESELIWQPMELERDGLYGTPDGLMVHSDAIWECKLTTKKVQPVAGCWMYIKQGMTYCAMLGVRQVVYDVLWLLGDYSRPYQPVGTQTLVEFEERECETWWYRVREAAKSVRAE